MPFNSVTVSKLATERREVREVGVDSHGLQKGSRSHVAGFTSLLSSIAHAGRCGTRRSERAVWCALVKPDALCAMLRLHGLSVP